MSCRYEIVDGEKVFIPDCMGGAMGGIQCCTCPSSSKNDKFLKLKNKISRLEGRIERLEGQLQSVINQGESLENRMRNLISLWEDV